MPRYFIVTSNHVRVEDEQGIVVADRAALRELVRDALIAILHDEGGRTGADEFTAEAYDEAGICVMRARAGFIVADQ